MADDANATTLPFPLRTIALLTGPVDWPPVTGEVLACRRVRLAVTQEGVDLTVRVPGDEVRSADANAT